MSDIYAIYDPTTDRVVGIYGTNRTMNDDRRNMLVTVNHPGQYWHKEAQAYPDRWKEPEKLEFIFLESFFNRSDRQRLVAEWRSNRFAEARSIARKRMGQNSPGRGEEADRPDRSDCSFVERVEQWAALTKSLFGGDIDQWINDADDADREKVMRLLTKRVGGEATFELAALLYNALCNYERWSGEPCAPTTFSDDEIPY